MRQGYIGLNNLKIGRIAGWMVSMAVRDSGKAAVFVGGHRWQGHELREVGFRAYLREHAPHLEILDTLVNLETRQLTYEAMLGLLARQPTLRAVYVAGGGMEGAIAALREVRQPGEVCLVVNELTSEFAVCAGRGLGDNGQRNAAGCALPDSVAPDGSGRSRPLGSAGAILSSSRSAHRGIDLTGEEPTPLFSLAAEFGIFHLLCAKNGISIPSCRGGVPPERGCSCYRLHSIT